MNRILRPIFAAGLALAACIDGEPAPLNVSITVSPAQFRAGETASVQLVVTNVSGSDQQVDPGVCSPRFSVTNAGGAEITLPPRVCSLELVSPVTLAPGESMVIEDSWTGQEHGGSGQPPRDVPPGDYTLAPTRVHPDARGPTIGVKILPPIE